MRIAKLVYQAIFGFLLLSCSSCSAFSPELSSTGDFVVSPYLQLGYNFSGNELSLVWLSKQVSSSQFSLDYKATDETKWKETATVQASKISGHPELSVFQVEMTGLPQSAAIEYRLKKDGQIVFSGKAKSCPAPGKAFSFSVFGDVGQGTRGETRIASLLKSKAPGLGLITGDIVYPYGSIKYYLQNFFPYLNESRNPDGAVMSGTVLAAAAGNHDLTVGGGVDARDLDRTPDSLAYFLLWKQPLNGPLDPDGQNQCKAQGSAERIKDFEEAAGKAYPRMTNYSFDYGNCHFIVLDANHYMDWTNKQMRDWVENDLKSSKQTWKFAVFHQPGFNSDFSHWDEQRMRLLSDVFERGGVDIAFAGHSHSYQRTYPLSFKVTQSLPEDGRSIGQVKGELNLDREFDGQKNCRAKGVIYVISGAGGARLSPAALEDSPDVWQAFTKKFSCKKHSITLCHVNEKQMQLEQLDEDGQIIDKITLQK